MEKLFHLFWRKFWRIVFIIISNIDEIKWGNWNVKLKLYLPSKTDCCCSWHSYSLRDTFREWKNWRLKKMLANNLCLFWPLESSHIKTIDKFVCHLMSSLSFTLIRRRPTFCSSQTVKMKWSVRCGEGFEDNSLLEVISFAASVSLLSFFLSVVNVTTSTNEQELPWTSVARSRLEE